jgi:hypothetical protein
MTDSEIQNHVKNTVLASRKATGVQWQALCRGIDPAERGRVAIATAELIQSGIIEKCETRVFDCCGNAETVTNYRRKF